MLRTRPRRLDVSRLAHNQALHYLARARAGEYRLSDLLRQQLTEVVHGYTGRRDAAAARAGIEWMPGQARMKGKRVSF